MNSAALELTVGAPPFKLVCATDGNTYTNEQFIEVARCQNYSLKKKHDGPCKYWSNSIYSIP